MDTRYADNLRSLAGLMLIDRDPRYGARFQLRQRHAALIAEKMIAAVEQYFEAMDDEICEREGAETAR